MADENALMPGDIPDWVKEAEEQMKKEWPIDLEEKKEVTIKFGKGLVGEPFTSKGGHQLVEVKIPNLDPADKTPWASFVISPKMIHDNKFGKGVWMKLPEDGTTKVSKPIFIGTKPDGKNVWERDVRDVPNTELKTMMENQKRIAEENKEVFGTENPAVFCSARSAESDAIVMKAHEKARAVLRKLCPQVRLGLTLSLHDVQAADGCEKQAEQVWNSEFSHYVPYIKDDDFLGVQCYSRSIIGENGPLPVPEGAAVTQMGYENYPESLEHVIRRVHAEFGGDIIVTENGIATADDAERVKYLGTAIAGVQSCIRDGIPVKGYFCWSLLDNFEWQKGFAMTFGLIAVDRSTQKRFPKPSLAFLGSYAPD